MTPISFATEGHITLDDCKVLSLATVGHLGCAKVTVTPEPEKPRKKSSSTKQPQLTEYIEDIFLQLDYTLDDYEEEEIILIIKMFLRCL